MSIGQNIRNFRKERGYTQRELAELLGVSVQAISKWETDAGAPDISQVVPLARALDISTDALFDYTCKASPENFEAVKKDYHRQSVFRNQKYSEKDYALIYPYFSAHPQNAEAAAFCLKCLVDLIAAGKVQDKNKSELIAECEKYADCIFKYETDADSIFSSQFILARGYSALGEKEKARQILQKIPVVFGDRLYWEAEIAQADKEYDVAMSKCRESFALKARYVARCIRMAGEVHEDREPEKGLAQHMEYWEYMLRLLNAFLSGGDYLPCRQIFQKHSLLNGMVRQYIKLGKMDLAIERAEMLFEGRREFVRFLENPECKCSLMFEDNDTPDDQAEVKQLLDEYVANTVRCLKDIPGHERNQEVQALLSRYGLR